MKVTYTVGWGSFLSPMELGDFFASEQVEDHIKAISDDVVATAKSLLSGVDAPKDVETAVTLSSSGGNIYWATTPGAVGKKIFAKDPKEFPMDLPGGWQSKQLVGLVIADHPNSENYQYGLNGFPVSRFFTGALARVAAESWVQGEFTEAGQR